VDHNQISVLPPGIFLPLSSVMDLCVCKCLCGCNSYSLKVPVDKSADQSSARSVCRASVSRASVRTHTHDVTRGLTVSQVFVLKSDSTHRSRFLFSTAFVVSIVRLSGDSDHNNYILCRRQLQYNYITRVSAGAFSALQALRILCECADGVCTILIARTGT